MSPRIPLHSVLLACALAICSAHQATLPAHAAAKGHAGKGGPPPPPPIVRLALTASPSVADVGGSVLLTLSAASWSETASVSVSFLSPHHGFTGQMAWSGACRCFRVAVFLAKRIHPLERARAVANVLLHGARYSAATAFLIRGLARNGRDFAPGGPTTLTAWVSDPSPRANETEHFCAWLKTTDGLGIRNARVAFSVHFLHGTRTWGGGLTNALGIACIRKSIGHPSPRGTIAVDAWAGGLHARTAFTPHA